MDVNYKPGILLLSLLAWTASAHAEVTATATWDQVSAVNAAQSVNTMEVRRQLINLTVAGSSAETLELLRQVVGRKDWPVPAREAAIFRYTQELRTLPSSAVPYEVMFFLKSYQAQTLVSHDDHPEAGIPLFNIRAAAEGVENGWRRRAAMAEGSALMASNPRSLVDAFVLEAHPASRQGYLEALEQASPGQLQSVAKHASRRLRHQPELTELAGRAALLNADTNTLQKVLVTGNGPGLAHLMRESAQLLSPAQNGDLLDATLEGGSTEVASLAMAELAPVIAEDPGIQSLLLQHLGDPELGGAAALALARSPAPDTIRQLKELAGAPGESLAASRAALALELNRTQFGGEVQR